MLLTEVVKKELQQRESQNEWQSFSMQNKSSHTKKGAINIADTIFLLQNPSTTDKIDTKYRVVLLCHSSTIWYLYQNSFRVSLRLEF